MCACVCLVVSNTCCVFALLFFVLCTLCCQFLWIIHFRLPLRESLTLIFPNYKGIAIIHAKRKNFLVCVYIGLNSNQLHFFHYQLISIRKTHLPLRNKHGPEMELATLTVIYTDLNIPLKVVDGGPYHDIYYWPSS